ncbi:MAG: beta-glucosidase [Bifidobacteriaceae bacterium]|nr:beta-glucosidase [Bifidobacteriaceae bacterium]
MPAGFPPAFTWGAATASYQIEGAWRDDGRGLSIWDTFSHEPGNVAGGDTGDVACDHYHRSAQDVALFGEMGLGAYRFSVAWPRIQPTGAGQPNAKGLDFYSRLVDNLLAAGIAPVLTLYHWDLPQALQDVGGWTSRETALRFGDYAEIVAAALGDRVHTWTTLNEPWCSSFLSYASGIHAPGLHDDAAALAAAHHLNFAHGLGAQAVRSVLDERARVSVTLNVHAIRAASSSEADLDAKRQIDAVGNEIFIGPMLEGSYPEDLLSDTAAISDWAFVRPGDLIDAQQPIEALGVNYYSTSTVRRLPKGQVATGSGGHGSTGYSPWVGAGSVEFLPPTGPLTAMGWNIEPEALTTLLTDLHRRFPDLELMVTENGAAFEDEVGPSGVSDPRRIDYLDRHIGAVGAAIEAGVPVTAYFVWSAMDNFEWAYGYAKRFGLIYVDYATQERVWKDSARWYRDLIAAHGEHRGQ